MREVYFLDDAIRKLSDGKRYYIRRKIYRRGLSGTITIRTHKDGKGVALCKTKVSDASSLYELNQAMHRLQKKFGRFVFVVEMEIDKYIPNPHKE